MRKRPRRVQKKIDRRAGAVHYSGHFACSITLMMAAMGRVNVSAVERYLSAMATALQDAGLLTLVRADHGVTDGS